MQFDARIVNVHDFANCRTKCNVTLWLGIYFFLGTALGAPVLEPEGEVLADAAKMNMRAFVNQPTWALE